MSSSLSDVLFVRRSPGASTPWQLNRMTELAAASPAPTRFRAASGNAILEIVGMRDMPPADDAASGTAAVDSWYRASQLAEIRGEHADADAAGAPIIYTVAFDVPPDRHDEFNRWYEEEHAPLLLQSPRWLMCRRFRVLEGGPSPATHLACYFLAGMDAMEAPQREEAKHTPWRARLAQEPWFKARFDLYEAVRPAR